MSNERITLRTLSSGRKLEIGSSVNRVLKSGRLVSQTEPTKKRQRTLYSQIGTTMHNNDEFENDNNEHELSSKIEINERKPREHEPTKKLLLQAVSDANKSVLMKLNKTSGIVKIMKPDGTTECLTTRTLAKRLKAKEPTWIDPTSLVHKSEPTIGKMKVRIRNEYCSTTDGDKSNDEQSKSPMEFDDDEEDEFVVVVNNDYETGDDNNNIWMINDYPYNDNGNNLNLNEYEDGRGNGTCKRKLSDDGMSDDTDQQQYSPQSNPLLTSAKKGKRCRFWPQCQNGDQCEFVHPTQRCIHFPNCVYGVECLYIHPSCRFGSTCAKSNCPYLHSTVTPASSGNNTTTNTKPSIQNRPDSSVPCKYGFQCMRPNCMYSHPRMSYPGPRNYKWVNRKWHASPDDMPILQPTSKTTNYENPFKTNINKETNSNDNEIET